MPRARKRRASRPPLACRSSSRNEPPGDLSRAVALVSGGAGQSTHIRAFEADDLQRIDALVEQAMARSNTVGLSLAITHRGRLVFARAYGRADSGSRQPLRITNRFRIASVSKPLTAIEIMRLA